MEDDIRPIRWQDYRGGAPLVVPARALRECRVTGPTPVIFDPGIIRGPEGLRTAYDGRLADLRANQRRLQATADVVTGQAAVDAADRARADRIACLARDAADLATRARDAARRSLAHVAKAEGISESHGDDRDRGRMTAIRSLESRL